MQKGKVVIRVDGNSNIGLGHIYRGIALADMLKDDYIIEFLSKKDTSISPIINAGFNYKLLPERNNLSIEPDWINKNYSNDTIIVLDGYEFDEDYQQNIKNFNFTLIYIDDLAKGKQKADLVINHSPSANKEQYITEPYTQLALGLNYALLRNSFIKFNRQKKQYSPQIKNIFVSFGGADLNDFSLKTVKELLNLKYLKTINIVLGAAYNHNKIYKLNSSVVKIHKNISEQNVFQLMNSADLAIVSASTTSIELASLGIPMILGYYVDNQKDIYKGFVEKDCITGVENFNKLDFSDLSNKINILNKHTELKKYGKKLITLFAGNPKDNIRNMIKASLLSVRRAENKDLIFLYNLANDKLTRSNSYKSENIELSEHKKWFQNQLNNKEVLFLIAEYQNKQAGQIRFAKTVNHTTIGISISENYRGQGLASIILEQATKEYFKHNKLQVFAYIKKINFPSIKSFTKAGYKYYRDTVINNTESVIYKKEKQ